MKAIKMVSSGIIVLVIAVLIGCSDQLKSPVSGGESNSMSEELLSANSYSAQFKMRPQGTFTFTASNTKLKKITSINAEVVSLEELDLDLLDSGCDKIAIYSDSKTDHLLNCQSKGLDLKTITVKNVSSGLIDLKISLYGERVKSDPNAIE